jgi:hypothetical protein
MRLRSPLGSTRSGSPTWSDPLQSLLESGPGALGALLARRLSWPPSTALHTDLAQQPSERLESPAMRLTDHSSGAALSRGNSRERVSASQLEEARHELLPRLGPSRSRDGLDPGSNVSFPWLSSAWPGSSPRDASSFAEECIDYADYLHLAGQVALPGDVDEVVVSWGFRRKRSLFPATRSGRPEGRPKAPATQLSYWSVLTTPAGHMDPLPVPAPPVTEPAGAETVQSRSVTLESSNLML